MDQTTIWIAGVGLAGLATALALLFRRRKPSAPAPAEEVPELGAQARACFEAINSFRAANGLHPLALNSRLSRAAGDHAFRMGFTHRLCNEIGGTVGPRVSSAGYCWARVSQNVGRTGKGGAAMAGMWAGSDGNRPGLLNRDYVHAGVGSYRNYYCAIFAAPR
jgi:LPXTG-motif cell wall-anchored protein